MLVSDQLFLSIILFFLNSRQASQDTAQGRGEPGSSPGRSPGSSPGSSQETIWDHQHLQGLRTALNTIYWCPSAAECKTCIYFSISRGVFESRCHQVPKITIQNGPREFRRNTARVMGSSNPTRLEPLQINVFGELHTPQEIRKVMQTNVCKKVCQVRNLVHRRFCFKPADQFTNVVNRRFSGNIE